MYPQQIKKSPLKNRTSKLSNGNAQKFISIYAGEQPNQKLSNQNKKPKTPLQNAPVSSNVLLYQTINRNRNESNSKNGQYFSLKKQMVDSSESDKFTSPRNNLQIALPRNNQQIALSAKQYQENSIIQEVRFNMLPQSMPYHPLVDETTMLNLQANFSGAIFSSQAFTQINYVLMSLGFKKENTLFASSVCVDEINHYDSSLNNRLKEFWGECFYMGGLGGIPFIGKVGFGAFSAHVPKNGNLFIFFAPHVGVSPDGQIGKYARDHQEHHDKACGAAIGALGLLKQKPPGKGDDEIDLSNTDLLDIQFYYIQQALKKHYHKIVKNTNSNDEQAALAFAMYDIVQKFVREIVNTIPGGKVILVGGIQINMKKPIEDMFLPMCFEILEQGKPPQDFSKVFMWGCSINKNR